MSDLTLNHVVPEPQPPEDRITAPKPDEVEVGQWFWLAVQHDGEDESEDAEDRAPRKVIRQHLCCVTKMGSNYAELTEPSREERRASSWRVHFDGFYNECVWAPNALEVIAGYLAHHRSRLDVLMLEMKAITARLGVAPSRELHATNDDASALSTTLSGKSYADYKADLVKAKQKELPAIFNAIKVEHAQLAKWMSAELLPLKSKLGDLESITAGIEARIFNVELYAGLVEQVVQVRDGEPAQLTEPLHLLQRRHYMDEECLAHYEVGGMQFKHVGEFDAWVARDGNMKRLLPFERCVVAFRVRRRDVQRKVCNLSDWIQLWYEQQQDRKTYLYIRNGERLYRMTTGIDFGHDLFPDVARLAWTAGTKMWGAMSSDDEVAELITDHDHVERVQAWEARVAAEAARRTEWEARRAAATPEEVEKDFYFGYHSEDYGLHFDKPHYEPFDKSSVHYDDIAAWRQEQVDAHNRVALVIQGLLDRSPVFHPHPPWQIWTAEGFEQAIRLVYDDARALTTGAAPNFEAYRRKLNASLKKGSVTVGQRNAWVTWRKERRENEEKVVYGDPGPPCIATVEQTTKSTCTYAWTRKAQKATKGAWVQSPNRPDWGHFDWYHKDVAVKWDCPVDEVLNVSAYVPGDFRQFFDDPRTRADYIEWAPPLLAAEEWHAGRKSGTPKEEA